MNISKLVILRYSYPIFYGLIFTLTIVELHAQKKVFYGYVKEQMSGEPIQGANIQSIETKKITQTNAQGLFVINLESDSSTLIISHIGFKTQTHKVFYNVPIYVDFESIQLNEIQVNEVSNPEAKMNQLEIGKLTIPVTALNQFPAVLGEKDAFRLLQMLPGIQKGNEISAGLYVRGGGPDQNLYIVDDAIIYNPFHVFGFISMFNNQALRSIELRKGIFPARYGGRLSSVVEMQLKDGNMKKFGGEAGLGILSAKIMLEGPIQKNKSSWLISARRSYVDVLTKPFLPDNAKAGFYFYDINAKATFNISDKDKLQFSSYIGRDVTEIAYKDTYYRNPSSILERNISTNIEWGNKYATLRWNHFFNPNIQSKAVVGYTGFDFGINANLYSDTIPYSANYKSSISDFLVKYDVDYQINNKHIVKVGISSIMHLFNIGVQVKIAGFDAIAPNKPITAQESGIYAEHDYRVSPRFSINYGMRVSHFYVRNTQYMFPEPRAMFQFKLLPTWHIKGGYSLINQYLHIIQNTGTLLPTDLWVPSTNNIAPQQSWQVSL